MMKAMKNIPLTVVSTVLVFVLHFAIPSKMCANPQTEIIKEANVEYSSGYYDHALELYLSVLEQGFFSAEVYYNAGNTFYKLNRIPEAILYYERALKLAPRDENIQFNLNLARTRTIDKIESIPELFYERWFRSLLNIYSTDGWGILSIVLLFIALVLSVIYLLSSRRGIRVMTFYLAILLFVLSLTALSFGHLKHRYQTGIHEAIVFDPSVTVKSSPSEASIDLFVIHEGTKVRITDQVGDWYEVRIASGSAGWLRAGSVEKI